MNKSLIVFLMILLISLNAGCIDSMFTTGEITPTPVITPPGTQVVITNTPVPPTATPEPPHITTDPYAAYPMPEVTAQYVENDMVNLKIKNTGENEDDYLVTANGYPYQRVVIKSGGFTTLWIPVGNIEVRSMVSGKTIAWKAPV